MKFLSSFSAIVSTDGDVSCKMETWCSGGRCRTNSKALSLKALCSSFSLPHPRSSSCPVFQQVISIAVLNYAVMPWRQRTVQGWLMTALNSLYVAFLTSCSCCPFTAAPFTRDDSTMYSLLSQSYSCPFFLLLPSPLVMMLNNTYLLFFCHILVLYVTFSTGDNTQQCLQPSFLHYILVLLLLLLSPLVMTLNNIYSLLSRSYSGPFSASLPSHQGTQQYL